MSGIFSLDLYTHFQARGAFFLNHTTFKEYIFYQNLSFSLIMTTFPFENIQHFHSLVFVSDLGLGGLYDR